jgi:hypothetical protein
MPTIEEDEDRREFLKTCGRFAAVTPPAMTLLLSTSLTSTAIARSGTQDGAGYSGGGGSSRSVFGNDPPHSSTKEHSTKEHSSACAVVGYLTGVAARTRVAERVPRSRIPERKAPDLEAAVVTRPPRVLAARIETTRRKGMSPIENGKSSRAVPAVIVVGAADYL